MRRRVPSQQLRGLDPVTLEVSLGDLLDKPLGQVAPANVADLFALADAEGIPGGLKRRIENFRKRIIIEIADLPNGKEFEAFIDELQELDAERLPTALREALSAQVDVEKRTSFERGLVERIEGYWADTEPVPFEVGAKKEVAEKAPAAGRRYEELRGPKVPRGERGAATRRTRSKASKPKKPARIPKPAIDPSRRAWVREVLLERLGAAAEKGLLDAVVIAGVRHRAREAHPDLSAYQVRIVLKELEQAGRIKKTSNRWILKGAKSW